MDRILVYGAKETFGGVEQMILEYVRHMARQFVVSFDLVVFCEDFPQQEIYETMGCRILYVPVRRKDPAGYKRRMEEIFRDTAYRAVWCNVSGLTNIDPLILGKKYKVPVRILHSHASILEWGSRLMKYVVHVMHWRNLHRFGKYATECWACSDVAGQFMFGGKPYRLIQNAVDTTLFCPDAEVRKEARAEFGIDDSTVVIGHVAQMIPRKNPLFLIRVMEQVVRLCPNAKLLFVGDGESKEEIYALVEELGLQDSVIFTGHRRDIPWLLRAMDVFVLPSLSEGLPVCAVEAQACGVPCVVSDRVSDKTDLTGGVSFLPLEESAEHWAKVILEQAGCFIEQPTEKLAAKGYDMVKASRELYHLFMGETIV